MSDDNGRVPDAPPEPALSPLQRSHLAIDRIRMVLARRHQLMGGEPNDPRPSIQASLISASVQHLALLSLCIERGLCTVEEYEQRLADGYENTLAQIEAPPSKGRN